MNIYIIRHAQTTMNAKGKVFSGHTDVSLSEKGVESAFKMSHIPIIKEIEHVYITPLKRTKETAEIVFGTSMGKTVIPELAEMDFGDYEGRIMTSENENDPVFYNWVHHPELVEFPNGENLLNHAQKAYQAFVRIAESQKYNNIAIVSHATTIRLVLSILLTGGIECFRNIPCDNGCFSLVVKDNAKLKISYINAPF